MTSCAVARTTAPATPLRSLIPGVRAYSTSVAGRKRGPLAVFASSIVGLVVDSVLFLYLAFGSLEFLTGQILGKTWMVLLALPVVHWIRKFEGVGAVAD